MKNPDVVIATETWLTSNVPIEAFNISGYVCHRTDRQLNQGHGGVAVWTKNRLQSRKLCFPSFDCFEVCVVQIPHCKVMIAGIYLTPGINAAIFNSFCESFVNSLDDLLIQFSQHRLILAGDFNRYNRSFVTSHFSLKNIVSGPTRLDATLDLIFVEKNIEDGYDKSKVEIGPPIGRSDHNTIFAPSHGFSKIRAVKKHILYDLRDSNIIAFEKKFLSSKLELFYADSDIDAKCSTFYECLKDAMSVIPQREVIITDSDAPWMSPLIKHLIDKRWEAFRAKRWNLYNSLKLKVKQEIQSAKKNLFKTKATSTKGLWSFINIERGTKGKEMCSFQPEDLNPLNEKFCSFMNPPSALALFDEVEDDSWTPLFRVEDVWRRLSTMPVKAAGSDGIPTLLYKKSALILAEPVHHLLSECFRHRKLPSAMKIADVVPVPKMNDSKCMRPISLLSVPAKLFEWFILRDLRVMFASRLGDNQFGIRPKSSTTHAIIVAHDTLTKLADDTKMSAAVFLSFDLSKAYDKVNHLLLVNKVLEMNFPTGFVSLLKDYLHDRHQRVRSNGFCSNKKSITSGIPQGSLLGPYLFGLYVASLQPVHQSTCMIKYVDDFCFIRGVRRHFCKEDIDNIKIEMAHLIEWSKQNDLTLNEDKTQGLVRYRGNHTREELKIEESLNAVNFQFSIRFLGVFLDESLGWTTHVNFIRRKCIQRMYILRRIRDFVDEKDFVLIYNGLIRSLMEYACPAFVGLTHCNSALLQRVQNRCLKIKGSFQLQDLSDRRKFLARRVFDSLCSLNTDLKHLSPSSLPSGRFSIPFCRTSLRRNAFIPKMCIELSSRYCD